ncbi:FecR family protein [Fibrella arboris]|uniref:FecR family protein n=1 Tax=Fibrella arboris TaxID=3242486 RepID=UPI0035200F47
MKPYAQYTARELAADDLFIRWVKHPEDDEVAAFWQGLEDMQPQLRIRFRDARQLVQEVGRSLTINTLRNDEIATVWGRIRGSLQDLEDVRPLRPEVRSFIGWWYFTRSIAAIIGIVLLVGWTVYKQYTQEASRLIATTTQSRRIALPDGSVVMLLPHSRLRYTPGGFVRESAAEGGTTVELTRAVWLDGAADFVVASPTGRGVSNAFRVHTDNLTAEATGTRFHVSHEQGETRVLLYDGKLDLLVGHSQVRHLSPGESVLVAGGDVQTE